MLDGQVPEQKPKPHYTPFGMAREIFYSKEIEAMFAGPAGTGKTRAGLELMDLRARKYPGSRHLVVRKTRTSLTQTALVTLNEEVLNGAYGVKFHSSRQDYTYPNESKIVVGGLDNATKIMSGQYDTIYVVEAVEASEDDWEKLMTRLRNGKMPYAQLYGDCNPDKPTHWIVQRANSQRLKLRNASHKDNPRLWDEKQQCLTPEGERYVTQILGSLTGVRRARLLEGRWVAAEGIVYDLDYEKHLLDNFNRFHGLPEPDENIPAIRVPPKSWKFYLSVDFGFTNPFVAQFWAEDGDGRLYLFLEIYQSQKLVEDHAATIKEICSELELPRFEAVICDHDAEGRATLEKHLGVKTTAAKKAVKEGIEATQSRYKIQADGHPRIFIQRDTVHKIDQNLIDRKLPVSTIDEIGGYIWDAKKDLPIKENDHGCDAKRYMVAHLDLRKNTKLYAPGGGLQVNMWKTG